MLVGCRSTWTIIFIINRRRSSYCGHCMNSRRFHIIRSMDPTKSLKYSSAGIVTTYPVHIAHRWVDYNFRSIAYVKLFDEVCEFSHVSIDNKIQGKSIPNSHFYVAQCNVNQRPTWELQVTASSSLSFVPSHLCWFFLVVANGVPKCKNFQWFRRKAQQLSKEYRRPLSFPNSINEMLA